MSSARLHPQFHIVLPENTALDEVRLHVQARLSESLAERFEIAKIKSVKTGKIHTKNGPVHGEQFLVVLRPIGDAFESGDLDDGEEVLYEHPDFKKYIIH